MLSNLYALWGLSWLQGQSGSQSFTFYGITYPGLGLPISMLHAIQALVAFTACAVVGLHLHRYVKDGIKPSPGGVAALGSLYVWYLPTFAHPSFAYLIPLFHSMQYLVFVSSFKKNQVNDFIGKLKGREHRAAWVRDFLGYAVIVTLLGALSFELVPKFLDAQNFLHDPALGTSPFVAAFLMFINIHHYFIDNSIWRSNNDQVKKYLFASSSPKSKDLRLADQAS